VRTGAPNKAVRPGWAGQIGTSVGTHITAKRTESSYRGVGMKGGAAIPSKLGNELALNVGAGGPGTGRQVYKSGAQHGLQPARQMPKGRDFDV
jgi:hypothetical protein